VRKNDDTRCLMDLEEHRMSPRVVTTDEGRWVSRVALGCHSKTRIGGSRLLDNCDFSSTGGARFGEARLDAERREEKVRDDGDHRR